LIRDYGAVNVERDRTPHGSRAVQVSAGHTGNVVRH
jgi:hypothetical protein